MNNSHKPKRSVLVFVHNNRILLAALLAALVVCLLTTTTRHNATASRAVPAAAASSSGFTITSPLNLLGEVRGVGFYDEAIEEASSFEVLGYTFKVIALDKLILAKRAAGRPKDMIAVAELEALLEQQNKQRKS